MRLLSTSVLLGMAGVLPAKAQESFTSAEFLEWKRSSQEFYIDTSIGMAGLIIGHNDRGKSQCVDDWYYKDKGAATDFILETMRQYLEFHPRGTLAAIIEKKCGSLKF